MNLKDRLFFTRKLEALYKSGKPLVESLEHLARNENNAYRKEIFTAMKDEIKAGGSLYSALTKYEEEFGEVYCKLVKAGEMSGKLDSVLGQICRLIENLISIRHRSIAAAVYPTFLIIGFSVGSVTLFAFLTDKFYAFLKSFHVCVPPFLEAMHFIQQALCSPLCCVCVSAVMLLAILFSFVLDHIEIIDNIKSVVILYIPGFGHLEKYKNLLTYVYTLKICYESGLSVLDSAALAADAVMNDHLYNKFVKVYERIKDGQSIAGALSGLSLFSHDLLDLIRTGEDSGRLDETLTELINHLDTKMSNIVTIIIASMKPIGILIGFAFLILIFIFIGTLVFSILSNAFSKL